MEYPATQKDSSTVMNPVRRAGLFILLFGLGLLFWSVPAHSENAVVVRVIDGDTIRVWLDDSLQTVRLLGVDTPRRPSTRPKKCRRAEPVFQDTHAVQAGNSILGNDRKVRLQTTVVGEASDSESLTEDRHLPLLRFWYELVWFLSGK